MLKFFKNAVSQLFTYGIRGLSDFIVIVLIGRLSGISNLGIYSFAITFSLAARFVLDLGFGMYLIREISKKKSLVNKYISNTIFILLMVSPLLIFFTYTLMYFTVNETIKVYAVTLSVIGMVFMSISTTFQASFHAFQKMEYQTIVIFIQEISFLLSVFFLLYFNFDFILIFIFYTLSRFLSMIFSALLYNYKIHYFKFSFDCDFLKKLIKEVSPFIINLIFTTIYARSAIIVISYVLGNKSVGLFEVGLTLTLKGVVISQVISKSLFPALSKLYQKSKLIEFDKISELLIKVIVLISLPICLGLYLYASQLIQLLFPNKDFIDSIILIKIMSLALLFKLISIPIADILTTSNKQEFRTISVVAGAIINLLLLYLLIPNMGIVGAAISMLVSELSIFIFILFFSSNTIKIYSIKLIFIGLFNITIPVILLYLFDIQNITGLIIFLGSYFSMLLITKTFKKSFIEEIKINMRNI